MARCRRPRERPATAAVAILGLALSRSTTEALRPTSLLSSRKTASGGAVAAVQHRSSFPAVGVRGSTVLAALPSSGQRGALVWRLEAAGYGPAFGQRDGSEDEENAAAAAAAAAKNKRLIQRAAAAAAARATGSEVSTAMSAGCQQDKQQREETGKKRQMVRRVRRRAKAKIQAILPDDTCSSAHVERGAAVPSAATRTINTAVTGSGSASSASSASSGVAEEASVIGGSTKSSSGRRKKRRNWGVGAVGDVVVGRPSRYVRRKIDRCKSYIGSRQRVHWASLAMATYIFATSVVPRLPSGGSGEGSIAGRDSTSGGYGYSYGGNEEDPTLPSSGLYSYEDSSSSAANSKRRGHRRQTSYYGENDRGGGGIDTAITHLDDHAEQLWHDSPAIRAAAAAAAAAAAEAAEASPKRTGSAAAASSGAGQEVKPQTRGDDSLSSSRASPNDEGWKEEQKQQGLPEVQGPPDGSTGTVEGRGRDDGSSGGNLLGGVASGDHAAAAAAADADLNADPGLRTHTDLGDLELAAEKALDLLRDSGDVGGFGDVDNGGRGGGGEVEAEAEAKSGLAGDADAGPNLHTNTDQGDLESAVEMAPGFFRDGGDVAAGGSGGGSESSGRSGEGANSANVAEDERGQEAASGMPVRFSASASTGSAGTAAAVPARGYLGPGSSARGHVTGQQRQPQQGEGKQDRQSASGAKDESSPAAAGMKDAARGKEEEATVAATSPKVVPQPAGVPAAGGDVSLPAVGGGGGRARHSTSFVAVAARAVSPAVCRIDMERLVGSRHDAAPFADVEMGQGSGLIFSSEEGLVLTNAHVVAGARKV
ncbi:unnamed protein product, partial [Hapterophycus canaliculatus]